jgi:hypothetical protein
MELLYYFSEFTAQLFEQKLSKIIFLFLFNNLFILQVRLRKIQLQQKQRKLKANNNRKKMDTCSPKAGFFRFFYYYLLVLRVLYVNFNFKLRYLSLFTI